MYTILVNEDNFLMTTKRERIMQRSKLVDDLQFLVPQYYKKQDMSTYTVQLEYITPCSKQYRTEILQLSSEMYQDHLKYELPFDTKLTSEAGAIEIQLTFVKTELDSYGRGIQRVRKTSKTQIQILPISAWSDIIPDEALAAMDERLIKMDAQIRAIDEMNQVAINTKADNLKYNSDTNELQLMANGSEIGDKIALRNYEAELEEALKDGVPVVDFGGTTSGGESSDESAGYKVVEF